MLKKRELIYLFVLSCALLSFCFSFAINSIVTFLFLPFFFLDSKESLKRKFYVIRKSKLALLFGLFFLSQIVGLIHTENISFGIKKTILLLPCVFLPAIIVAEKLSTNYYNLFLKTIKLGTITIFLFFFFLHIIIDERSISTFVYFTIQEKIGVSQFYLSFVFLVSIYECIRQIFVKRKQIIFNSIFLCFFMLLLTLLGSRTILVLTFISFVFYFLYKYRTKSIFFRTSILLFLFISIGTITQSDIINRKVNVFIKTTDLDLDIIKTKNSFTITKNTFEHRILINYLSLKEILKSLPFGIGTGDYKDLMAQKYEEINFKAGITNQYNLHNQYFTEFLKTGLIGGIVFLSLILYLLANLRLNQDFYIYLIFTFSVACLFESYLDRQHGVFIFSFLLPFFLNYENNLIKKDILEEDKIEVN